MRVRRIGVLTSGGDAPGMNPAVRAVVRAADAVRIESYGITSGYDGLIKGNLRPLGPRDVGDINHRGGTILRTARCPEMHEEDGRAKARHNLAAEGIDASVVIGGDGSLRAAHLLDKEGMPTVGVPASIDNDLWGTTMAIGVDTALNTIVDAVDRLRDTAQSHQRVFLVETMGRNSGYLALLSGIACGAEMAIIPERETTLEDVAAAVSQAYPAARTMPSSWWPREPGWGSTRWPTSARRAPQGSSPGSPCSAMYSGAGALRRSTASSPAGSAPPPSVPSSTASTT